jgi:fibronectin-binding autotransporter adhesin
LYQILLHKTISKKTNKNNIHPIMKIKSTALLSTFIFASSLHSQTVRTWNGSTGGAWHTVSGSTWSPASTFAGDGGGTVTGEGGATDIMSVAAANAATNVGLNMSTLNGSLTLGAINFDKTNAATLVMGNSSTSASGILLLNGATVDSVDKTLVRVAGAANLTIQNRNSGSDTNTLGLRLGITDGIFKVTAGRTLQIFSNISESGTGSGFTKTGAGILLIGGTNSFTGNTAISEGMLVFRTTASKPASTTHTFATGTVLGLGIGTGGFSATDVVNAFAGTFTGSLAGISIGETNNIALDNGAFAGNIGTTTRGLEKTDNTGNLTLTGLNQYSGRTVVGGGNGLNVNSFGNKGDVSSNVGTNDVIDLKNGARIDNTAVNTSNKDLNLLGATAIYFNSATLNSTLSGTVSTETVGLKTFSLGGNTGTSTPIFSGLISDGSGQLALTKSQAGQWTLSSANTHTGATIMGGGSLILGHSLALQNSPLNTTSSIAGTSSLGLQAAVTDITFGGLTGTKALASLFNTTGTTGRYNTVTALTLNPATGATHTYDAAIANGASGMTLTKTGLGTQIFTVANTYTGATAVNGGTLLVNNTTGSGTGPGTVTVASGATFGGTGTVTGNTTINGNYSSGTPAVAAGVGTQAFSGNLAFGNDSIFKWDLNDNSIATGFDTLAVVGDITVGTGTTFDVRFGNSVNLADTFWSVAGSTKTWSLAAIFGESFTSGSFASVSSTANPATQGSFSINASTLTWTAVPEASNLLVGGLLGLGLMSRRRKQA